MKAAVWTNRGLGLQGLLVRSSRRPFVLARRLTVQAQGDGAELVEWVQRNGGSVQGVAVKQFDGDGEAAGCGLIALQDCRAGSCLISLPQCCHLTYDVASTDPRLLALIDQVPQELWGAKLALQVLAHRVQGEDSFFATYIQNLPRGVPGLPMFFNGEALAALQYPPVTEQVKRRCRWLLSFSQQVLAPLRGTPQDPFEGAEVDANALGWALGVVTSRAFRTRGPAQPAAMLPLIDMANHSFTPTAKIEASTVGRGGLRMVATRDLSAGDPVLLSYGNLGNDFLLMDYGFVVPGNPFDTVQLRFDPGLIEAAKAVAGMKTSAQEAPTLAAWQQAPLRALGLLGDRANTEVSIRRASSSAGSSSKAGHAGASSGVLAGGPDPALDTTPSAATLPEEQEAAQPQEASTAGSTSSSSSGGGSSAACPVDPRLLAAVRVLCAKNAGELSGRKQPLGAWDKPLSTTSEVAALRALQGLCLITLSQFTTSLQEDQAALQAAASGDPLRQLSPDMVLAMQFRSDKKQLLLDAAEVLTARVKELAAAEAAAAAAAQGQAPSGSKLSKSKVPQAKHGGKGFGA